MTSERKKRRWWLWTLGAILGVILLIGAAGTFLLDRYAADIVTDTLSDANLPNPRVAVGSIGISESRLIDVRLGDDDALVADEVILTYDIIDLIDLDLSDLAIRLVRPTLKLSVDEDGAVSLGSLDRLMAGPSGDDAPLPFREIALDDATVLVATQEGLIEAQVDGTITNQGEDGLLFDLVVLADNDLALFEGDLTLTVADGRVVDGEATVRAIGATTPWGDVRGGSGSLSMSWSGEGLPVCAADLEFHTVAVPARLLPPGLAPGDEAMRLDDLDVDIACEGTAVAVTVTAADQTADNALSIEVRIPDVLAGGEATIAADVSTSGDRLLWLWHEDWIGSGALTASIEATVTLPPLAEAFADPDLSNTLPDGDFHAQWILNEADFPGIAHDVSSVGDVEVSVVDRIATVTSRDPVELRIGRLDPALLDAMGADDPAWEPILRRDLAGRIDIALDGRGARPMTLTVTHRDEGWVVRGDTTALMATATGPLAALELSGEAVLAQSPTVRLGDLSAYVSDLETPAASVGVLELAGRFAYSDGEPDFDLAGFASDLVLADPQLSFPRIAVQLAMKAPEGLPHSDVLEGPVTMSFSESGGRIDDVAVSGMSGEMIGRLRWESGLAQLFFTENAVFQVDSMDIDGDVVVPESSIVRITASESPVLELDLDDDNGWSLRHSLSVGPLDLRGSVRLGDDRVQTALRTRALDMEGGFLDGRYVTRIAIDGVSIQAPARGWTVGGGSAVVEYDDDDPRNLVVVSANLSDVGSAATAGALPPLGLRGRMDYGLDDVIQASARVFDRRNLLIADVTIRHDLAANLGVAEIEVQDLIFNPVVLQPGDISPLLSDFENVTGTADVEGRIRWSAAGLTPELALLIRDISGEYDDVAFERMNAVVELSSLAPLETAPGQLLSIATVDPGVPISNAEIWFAITGGDTLAIERATFDLAGGILSTENQAIVFNREEQELSLAVTGVDLDTLFAFADLESLEAEGTLDGTIPILIVDGDVVIPDARLTARAPGFIRYDAGADLGAVGESNAGVDLMVQLLKDFRYDELELRLMRPVAGDMEAGFRILGRNPEVYGGVPIDLTLNVDGELEDVIRSSLEIYRVPETIQDLIMEYGFEAAVPPG